MAAEVSAAHARLAPPSGCASPLRDGRADLALLQRPFSASGARKTQLVAVLVHWGEHLDRLRRDADVDAGDAESELNTYVALRVDRQPTSEPSASPAVGACDDDAPQNYELRSSPFATSRVVERSAHPMWNELLLVALPADWKQHKDAAAYTLYVDVVRRDPSQQEDVLLMTAVVPLWPLLAHRVPHHFAVDLAPSVIQPVPRVYLSLSEPNSVEYPDEVLEMTIEDVEGIDELVQVDTRPEALMVLTSVPHDVVSPLNLRSLFTNVNQDVPQTHHTWITPSAKERPAEGATHRRVEWQFPAMFLFAETLLALPQLTAYLFSISTDAEGYAFQCIGTSVLNLEALVADGTATRLSHKLSLPGETAQIAGVATLKTTARRWDASAWTDFHRTSVSRRVITTNRRHRKRVALQALEWTGALCRGLNRYPISSFCDEGGLSGLLANYLAATNSETPTGPPSADDAAAPEESAKGTRQPEDLLNHHISLLQQEVMAKQEAIQKLQHDLDANTTALRKCGLELVAARKELRSRDEQVNRLETTVKEMEQREVEQTRELLSMTGGMSGLRLDSQGTQRLNMLIFKYKELEQRHAATEVELAEAKHAVGAFEVLERKYADLEQAHVVQAGLIQRLQKDKAQQGELERTIRIQEKVINKLERALELHRKSSSSPENPNVMDSGTAEPPKSTHTTDSPLLAVRVQVLEQQLETNAKAAASEIGRLKMRVLELETQLSAGVRDAANAPPLRRPER